MDELILSITKFKISNNKSDFENDLDSVINKFNNQSFYNPDYEWNTLCSNYSKLKYLDELIENFYMPESEKFLLSMEKFMEKIDIVNIRYLNDIAWDHQEDDHDNAQKIKKLLDLSLLEKDPIGKMKICLNAYKLFVIIAEDCRDEEYKPKIYDTSFIKEFSYKRKRI